MKIILIKRVILFLIASIVMTTGLPILMDIYFSRPFYTGIVFLLSIAFCFIVGRKTLQKEVEIKVIDDIIYLDEQKFELSELQSYNFDNTGYIYKTSLKFVTKKMKLYILLKQSGQYLEFKKYLISRINLVNKTSKNQIDEYNWYKTKSAKIYGYITVFTLFSWIIVMLVYPEKFKLSNLGLFLITIAGLFPILYKIFRSKG